MKIDVGGNFTVFRGVRTAESAAAKASGDRGATAKTDVVDFSRGSTAAPEKNMAGIKSSVLGGASKSASPERLQELKESVRSGAYRVPTEDIVKSILDLNA